MTSVDEQRKLRIAYALQQSGSLVESAGLYREILRSNHRNFHALHFLGIIEAQLGNMERAKELLARSMAIRPQNIQFMENFAAVLLQTGDYARALDVCRRGLTLNRKNVTLMYMKASSLLLTGKLRDALKQCDKLLLIDPNHVAANSDRAFVLAELKQYERAMKSVDKALELDQNYVDAILNKGNLYAILKRFDEALAAYDKALRLNPTLANAWIGRGNVLRRLKRFAQALASYDRALAIDPALAKAWYGRGNVLRELDRPAEALTCFEKILSLSPDNPEAIERKAVVLLEGGRLDEASQAIEKAIELAPNKADFYYTLTYSKRLSPGDPHIQAMEKLAQDMPSLGADERIALNFALAKAYQDVGDRERSFRRLLEGNALKRKQLAYDEAAALGMLQRTRQAFAAERMRANQGGGDPSCVPVFILGMPRSGTTLVEQILASHPQVFGAGEIPHFGDAIAGLEGAGEELLHSPEAASLLSDEQLRRLGASYVGRIRALAPAAERITNKTTDNFRWIGLIHMALPNARIIHTRRDPVDTCLSCFSQMFDQDALPYAFDLGELGRYYRAYEATMAHWREALPANAMLEVRYEDVVADLEREARRVVAYCGLEWDSRCLSFHQTMRPVRTSSVTQVRQPIYASSVGRWRAYEASLGPLLQALEIEGK
ncbi:MAG: sulfotransferase [Roseiarcus sp.]